MSNKMSTYTVLQTSATPAIESSTSVRRRSSVNVPSAAAIGLEQLDDDAFETIFETEPKYKRLSLKSHPSDDGPPLCHIEDYNDGSSLSHLHPLRRPKAAASQFEDYVNVLDKYPMFRAYLVSHLCQHAGDWFVRIASLLVVQEFSTKGSALGNLVLATKLPTLLFCPVGGYLSDRLDRRLLMIALDLMAGVSVLGYLFAIRYRSLSILYVVTMLRSSIGAVYYPVTTGIVPLLVPNRRDLQYAATMNSWAWAGMAVMGGALAGFATAVIGLQACYVLDFVTFLASAALIKYGISPGNYSVKSTDQSDNGNGTSLTGRTYDVFKKLVVYLSTCGFGMLVLAKGTASLVWGPEDVIGSLFATERDNSGQEEVGASAVRTGVLFSAIGLGCLLGPALVNFITDANRPYTLQRAFLIGLVILTAGWLLIAMAPSYIWFVAFTVIRTMGSSVIWVNSTVMLQALTDKEVLGRVLSVEYTFYTLMEAASATITGQLDDAGFSTHLLALFAASLGVISVASWAVYHFLSMGAASPKFNPPAEDSFDPSVSSLGIELPSVLESVAELELGDAGPASRGGSK